MLMIGCGGSGGATLQYLMDGLRTELSQRLERTGAAPLNKLPDAWQFVHVDVPSTIADGGPAQRPSSVQDQGGTYAGLARPGLTWPMVAEEVWHRTKDTRPDLTSGWMRRPRNPDTPLERGAGQERAVGRGVTLGSITSLRSILDTVAGKLNSSAGMTQLRQLADGLGEHVDTAPVIFIVSSMAGGSGSSMVLDVPRVLSGYRAAFADNTVMFLYTSEVFSSIPSIQRRGVEANGLAMMGELLATSLGSSTSDNDLMELLGLPRSASGQPFKRVFPIGLRHGTEGAIFGDGSLESVYRAVGRALAGLIASPKAMEAFLQYDITNTTPLGTDGEWLGEGSGSFDGLMWGTFGFARLSLGRDRYGEYVAQRLSRQAVDRLVEGHLTGDENAGEADLQRSVEDARQRFLLSMVIPPSSKGSALALLARDPKQEDAAVRGVRAEMREVLSREVFGDGRFAGTLAGKAYARLLRGVLGQNRHAIDTASEDWAYKHAYRWQEQFVEDVLTHIDSITALYGLPVARQVILRFKDDVGAWILALQTEHGRPDRQPWSPELPAQVIADVEQNAAIGDGHPMQEKLSKWLSNQVANSAEGALARLLVGILEDFGPSFADPLAAAMAQQQRALQEARRRDPELGGQSDLRTSSYSDWPRPMETVPSRFAGAHNEVVLLDAQAFPEQYDAHITAMTRSRQGLASHQDAENAALAEILRDRWLQHNDGTQQSQVITLDAAWIPPNLITDPGDSTRLRSRSSARFAVRMGTRDVIERAREWVWREGGEFGGFLDVGLAEYMDPEGADFEERLRRLSSRFGEAMTQALPLVSVDPTAFGKVHRTALEVNYKYSEIPFAQSEAVCAALEDEVQRAPSVSQASLTAFTEALGRNPSDHIDVFATYPPMSPLAFSSLLQPLTSAWRSALAEGAASNFWTGRRAHDLPACIAMSPAERAATVAGYIVAKLTGRLRGSYRTQPHKPPAPIEVFDETNDRWLRFPHPLLSPYLDKYQMDELPALLESQLLAIAECGHKSDLSPLLPYASLRHTFATVVQGEGGETVDNGNRAFDRSSGDSYLYRWIVDGWRPAGAPPPQWDKDVDGKQVDLETAEGRKEAAIGFLTAFRDEYTAYFHPDDPRLFAGFRPFDRRPLMATIAPDFVWALGEVLALVEVIDLNETEPDSDGPNLVM